MPPPDLVVLLCDTARADAFRPWGGPHPSPTMERLCREGMAYSQATAPAPWTLPSIASMFSGRLPTEHGITHDVVRRVDGRPTSPQASVRTCSGPWLPEDLRLRGYRTWAASCNMWISTWGGFDRGFDRFVDLNDKVRLPYGRAGKVLRRGMRVTGRSDRGGRSAAREFRRALADSGPEPLFAFVNLMEVHSPYNPPGRYYPYRFWRRAWTLRLSGASKGHRPFFTHTLGLARPPEGYARTIRTLYYGCARYEDALLGSFVQAIEERGRPTVLVVVSDHGENLGEHGLYGHNTSLAQTLLHVPLVVWGQGLQVGSGWRDECVSLLGLPGYLTRVADGDSAPLLWDAPVVSEYESTIGWITRDIEEMIESRQVRLPPLAYRAGVAIRKGPLKYVAVEDGEQAVYHLEDDPGEGRDIGGGRPAAVADFLPLREAWMRRRETQPRYAAGGVADDEIADHLRELGYIE